ncbi:two-component regulator propeller domain-containing protein [Algivirga pacifica]|uniref:PPM-type phosphatase domain-containing protein n=1 Tax=Algivirga pacifica TaxID=1162670 RepID=A0ABP9D1L0_9BACT
MNWIPLKRVTIVLLSQLLLLFNVFAQQDKAKFRNLGLDDGLSQTSVFAILQDRQGFMWFGTEDGLNRYDGYEFKVYKADPLNKNSLANSYIYSLLEDGEGNIWVGTRKGVTKFNPEKELFTRYVHNPEDDNSIIDGRVHAIVEAKDGKFWLAMNNGLSVYDPSEDSFRNYYDKKDLPTRYVKSILETKDGTIWIGTDEGGLCKYLPDSDKFKIYAPDPTNRHTISDADAYALYEDRKGTLWVGTYGGGLNKFDPETEKFEHFRANENDPNALQSDIVFAIKEDLSGNLWVGTRGGGLSLMKKGAEGFTTFWNDPATQNSLAHNEIWTIYVDDAGLTWVGTGEGISIYNPKQYKFEHIAPNEASSNGLPHGFVWDILEDSDGTLWVATNNGFTKYNRQTNTFKVYQHDPADPTSIPSDRVKAVVEQSSRYLWLATNGGGICRMDKQTETFKTFTTASPPPSNLASNSVWELLKGRGDILWISSNVGLNKFNTKTFENTILNPDAQKPEHQLKSYGAETTYIDSDGVMWVGAENGLVRYDPKSKTYTVYRHDENDPNSLSEDYINFIYEDQKKRLWVGTGSGLNLFDPKTETFKTYTEEDGLPNNVIYNAIEDKSGNLWLTTNFGLSKFNPDAMSFRNYTASDGLQSNEFNGNAYEILSSGEFMIGGINGFNIFHPDSIKDSDYVPQIKITEFDVVYQAIGAGDEINGNVILDKNINYTKEIDLSYEENVVSFEVASLHYAQPSKNRYKYMLEGFNDDWIEVAADQRKVTYTNLDPKEYTFKVLATNNDGVWAQKPLSIKISVHPPFWMTWWFRILTVLVLGGSVYSWYRYRLNKALKQKKKLEIKVAERTEEVMMQTEELQQQAEELAVQRDYLSEKNELITQSIRYAETIQQAFLPSEMAMDEMLDEYFLFYKSKDLVSGDFYWAYEVNNYKFIVVADCTGHGVPGAFMSMIGTSLLNEIVKEKALYDPAQILEELQIQLRKSLRQEEGENSDGMDISVCRLEKTREGKVQVTFAGAKSTLLYCSNNRMHRLKGDNIRIGGVWRNKHGRRFKNKRFTLQDNDTLFMLSDGLADQNSPERKKLGSRKVEELLTLCTKQVNFNRCDKLIEYTLMNFQKNMPQRDDITVFGMKVKV